MADALGLAGLRPCPEPDRRSRPALAIIVVLMGTMTTSREDRRRRALTGERFILRQDMYATAAIAGIVLYLASEALGVKRRGVRRRRRRCGSAPVLAHPGARPLPSFRLPL